MKRGAANQLRIYGGVLGSAGLLLILQFAFFENLVEDVKRLNLFREVEIHCIGIGEANMGLLNQISRIGLGTATRERSGASAVSDTKAPEAGNSVRR